MSTIHTAANCSPKVKTPKLTAKEGQLYEVIKEKIQEDKSFNKEDLVSEDFTEKSIITILSGLKKKGLVEQKEDKYYLHEEEKVNTNEFKTIHYGTK